MTAKLKKRIERQLKDYQENSTNNNEFKMCCQEPVAGPSEIQHSSRATESSTIFNKNDSDTSTKTREAKEDVSNEAFVVTYCKNRRSDRCL